MYPPAFESGGEDQDRLDVRSLEEVAHLPSRIERDRFFLLDRDDLCGFDACCPHHNLRNLARHEIWLFRIL